MNPKVEAAAYRMYCYAKEREWDVTLSDIADALDIPIGTVRNIAYQKGWLSRFRVIVRKEDLSGNFLSTEVFQQRRELLREMRTVVR